MEKETRAPIKTSPWVWVLIAIGACIAVACCLLVIAGVFYFSIARKDSGNAPDLPAASTQPPTSTVAATLPGARVPTEISAFPTELAPWMLDLYGEAFYGYASLQRGFSPDPYMAPAVAGGEVNTAYLGFDCGFSTPVPTFSFKLGGGASDTFLRIFFVPDDGTDTTLAIYTPDHEWLCGDDSPFGSGRDPVVDLEFAPSGDYLLWAGTWSENVFTPGTLFITQSMDTTP